MSRPRGRGAAENPKGRFERLEIVPEIPAPDRLPTEYLRDGSRTIIASNNSPDVPFGVSINAYRGCEHGCIYCYARTTHEYLGFSAGLDFETKILVKENAAELLRRELAAPGWQPQLLGISGVTDPYQPIERQLELTRKCLKVLTEFLNPVALITKNSLVTRDLDLLGEMSTYQAAAVAISVTTLAVELARVMEPRTSSPRDRLQAIEKISAAGIPCGVSLAPVIPGLNDHEIPAILESASSAGARWANYLVLRLPGAVEPLFCGWLEQAFPERAAKILNRLQSMRQGRLNDSRFGTRMRGEGVFAEQIRSLYLNACERFGLATVGPELSTESFRRDGGRQQELF